MMDRKRMRQAKQITGICMLTVACIGVGLRAEGRPTRESVSGTRHNMFFPLGQVPELPDAPKPVEEPSAEPADEPEFMLLGTVVSGRRAGALVLFAGTDSSVWLGEGDVAGGLTVEGVRDSSILLSRNGKALLLTVGKSSRELSGQARAFAGAFKLLGVCASADSQFALIQVRQEGRVRRLNVNDRVGDGVVSAIHNNGIVLSMGPRTQSVRVGAAYPLGIAIQ